MSRSVFTLRDFGYNVIRSRKPHLHLTNKSQQTLSDFDSSSTSDQLNLIPRVIIPRSSLPSYLAKNNHPLIRSLLEIAQETMAGETDTNKYKLNHTMIRVKDPERSIKFYKFLGLSHIKQLDFPERKFSLYFLAYDGPSALSAGRDWTDRNGVLELTHNYGTEADPSFKVVNGNEEPYRGFGHIAVSVDNIEPACKRLEDAGYPFQKKLTEGFNKNIAFVKDPDGYWVELVRQNAADASSTETDLSTYRLNHSMIRVKSPEESLKFYQDVMGMTLVRRVDIEEKGFTVYFLGYPAANPEARPELMVPCCAWEGVLELTWNHGTEKQEGKVYHDGNSEPQGFGHICVSVDNLDAACARFDEKGVTWKKRLTEGTMKTVAFILDPDGYWVEIIQNEALKKSESNM